MRGKERRREQERGRVSGSERVGENKVNEKEKEGESKIVCFCRRMTVFTSWSMG